MNTTGAIFLKFVTWMNVAYLLQDHNENLKIVVLTFRPKDKRPSLSSAVPRCLFARYGYIPAVKTLASNKGRYCCMKIETM